MLPASLLAWMLTTALGNGRCEVVVTAPEGVLQRDLVAAASAGSAGAQRSQSAIEPYSRAQALARADCVPEALAALQQVLLREPSASDLLWRDRARWTARIESPSTALRLWHEVTKKTRDPLIAADAWLGVHRAAVALGHGRQAERACAEAERLAPQHPELARAKLELARLLGAQGRHQDAAVLCRHLLLSADASVVDESFELLTIWFKLGRLKVARLDQAVFWLDRLIERHAWQRATKMLDMLRHQGVIETRVTKHPRSLKEQLDIIGRAIALGAEANLAAATEAWRQMALLPSSAARVTAMREQARLLGRAGRGRASSDTYLALAHALPGGAAQFDARFRAAFAAYDGGDDRHAYHLFAQLAALAPHDTRADEVEWFCAWTAFHAKNFAKVLFHLKRLIHRFPDSSLVYRAHYWRGDTLLRLKQPRAAQRSFRAALLEGTGYYAALARHRLNQLGPATHDALEYRAASASAQGAAGIDDDGTRGLNWHSAEGRHVLGLWRLGAEDEAARAVARMPRAPGYRAKSEGRSHVLLWHATSHPELVLKHLDAALLRQEAETPAQRAFFQAAFPQAFADEVIGAAEQIGISPFLIWAVMRQESSFDTHALSVVRAQGLMQLMLPTALKISAALGRPPPAASELWQPQVNIPLAAWYLRGLVEQARGNVPIALASYNAGPKVTQQWIERHADAPTDVFVEDVPYKETRNYIKKVFANLETYSRLYHQRSATWVETVSAAKSWTIDF